MEIEIADEFRIADEFKSLNKEKIHKDKERVGHGRGNRNNIINHKDTRCHICNSNVTHILPNGRPQWLKFKEDGNKKFSKTGFWDEKSYICIKCYEKETCKSPDSRHKRNTKFRNKELSKDSNAGKGFIGEQIFCKVRGVKNCNIESGNFHNKYDHSIDSEYGIVNTKCVTELYAHGHSGSWVSDLTGDCDNFCIICMNKEREFVERVYIIPESIVSNRTRLHISKGSTSKSWYEKYRIDEKPYNDAYHSMSLEECPVLKNE